MSNPTLGRLRRKIDSLDQKVLRLLNQRARVVLQIGRLKNLKNQSIYSPTREKVLLERISRKNKGPFPSHSLHHVFREILSASRALQSPMKAAYLGPEATFTHLAAIKHFGRSTDLIPEGSVGKVFDAVEGERADCGVVPIENSTEGVVGATLDRFMESSLKITGEITLPITHHLLARSGSVGSIRRIYSHPQATAQCRNWLEENLPNVPILEVESTARAAERAAGNHGAAAIASEAAAELYRLKVVRRHIEDSASNFTRFLVLGDKVPAPTGHDKSSVLFSVKDEVGILYRMLEPFSRAKINLTKIESRPLKKKAWEYVFFLDMEGHIRETRIKQALEALEKDCLFVKFLGSYARAA